MSRAGLEPATRWLKGARSQIGGRLLHPRISITLLFSKGCSGFPRGRIAGVLMVLAPWKPIVLRNCYVENRMREG